MYRHNNLCSFVKSKSKTFYRPLSSVLFDNTFFPFSDLIYWYFYILYTVVLQCGVHIVKIANLKFSLSDCIYNYYRFLIWRSKRYLTLAAAPIYTQFAAGLCSRQSGISLTFKNWFIRYHTYVLLNSLWQ